MGKSVEFLIQQIRGIRSSQINPGLVGAIKVSFKGRPTPIDHLATSLLINRTVSVSLNDPLTLKEDSGIVAKIRDAIARCGFDAYVFSKDTVAVSSPHYGQRDEVRAYVRRCGEQAKIAIRNVRKWAKKQGGMSEKELQRLTDAHAKEVDEIVEQKIKQI